MVPRRFQALIPSPPSYTICFYSDIASEPEVYYYPSTVETKLTGLVKSRNYEGIEEMLTALFTENLEKRSLTPQMQEVFSMSSSYFSTYFKKHLDVTFSKYLEGLRIEKACELIRNSDLNIEAIATEVGYTSSLSFRRAFKKVMGMPPSSYR